MNQKIAVITGASRGIGEATALRLAHQGYSLILIARTESELKRICDRVQAMNGNARYLVADLSTVDFTRDAVRKLLEMIPQGPDVLILNSGFSNNQLFQSSKTEAFLFELGVNYLAPATFIHELLPLMQKKKKAAIVATGSLTALMPFPGNASYAASKAALLSLLRTLRVELRRTRVSISVVLPGLTRTSMTRDLGRNFLFSMSPDEVAQDIERCVTSDGGIFIPGLSNQALAGLFRLFSFSLDNTVGLFARLFVPGYSRALRHSGFAR